MTRIRTLLQHELSIKGVWKKLLFWLNINFKTKIFKNIFNKIVMLIHDLNFSYSDAHMINIAVHLNALSTILSVPSILKNSASIIKTKHLQQKIKTHHSTPTNSSSSNFIRPLAPQNMIHLRNCIIRTTIVYAIHDLDCPATLRW